MASKGRRIFLKRAALSALSIPLFKGCSIIPAKKGEERVKIGQMNYRRLGRTGLLVSEISLGGSPVPEWPILLQAIDRGVNYIDTSHTYQNGNSERQIGRLFLEVGREKAFVGTKFHLRQNWSKESILQSVEGSLKRLQTDTIDVLLIHGASDEESLTDERVLSAFDELKKAGKCRFSGISCHSNHHKAVKQAIECGHYDVIQLGYNVFDIAESAKEVETYEDYLGASGIRHLISLARKRDVGIIAMKTLKVGGKRQNLEKYRTEGQSIFQLMLKWALANPNLASVVTEMLTFEQMEEDLAVAGQELTAAQKMSLYCYVAENSESYCHMCGICESRCPSEIRTTEIQRCLSYYESYAKYDRAKSEYARLNSKANGQECTQCGLCEKVCPYGISVRARIQKAERFLGG